ncbi:Uncharacterized protein APZ42_015748 [Daphnia magna]|uniref:Uncharacterized protein n=1 Tax=Daphnia magna TaxID=35525 RepID=A0A0P5ZBW3_9CRUS|nr:Uncharacterized protein APZ42_015748 [Daphnia magna]
MMFGLFNVTLIVALMLVTNIQVSDSFDWQREFDFQDGVNIYLNGNKQSTGNQKEQRQKRTSSVTTTVDAKFTVQLIVSVDPVTGQASLQQINGGRFGSTAPHPNARHCQGRQCNYSLSFQTVDSPVISKSQSKTTADEKVNTQNDKRVTAAPRYLNKPVINSTSASRITVRYPLPTSPSRKQIVNRTRTVNGEWARRTSARKPSVQTTTARNPTNAKEDLLLLKPSDNGDYNQSRAEEPDNLFHQKQNETDSNGNRKSQPTSHDSVANYSDKNGDVVQSSPFNESIFRDSEKPITIYSDDILSQTTSPESITIQPGAEEDNLNPDRNYAGPNLVPQALERRANFEVQINPRTKQIVNIRVPTMKPNSKPVGPSHEYKDSRKMETTPTDSSRKHEEFHWQHGDGYQVQINPKTEQVGKSAVRPHVEYEHSSAEKPVTPASGALQQTYAKHEELPWLQRDHHQAQIDPKTGPVVDIRTQTPTMTSPTSYYESPSAQTQERPAVRTQMVTREASLPLPFYYRKQMISHDPDQVTKESETVQTTTNSYSTPQPLREPNELPWQQRDGFEVQMNPITKEVVNVRIVQHSRYVPVNMHVEQATVRDSVTQPTTGPTLVFETRRDPGVFLQQHEGDDIIQTNETQSSTTPITLKTTNSQKGDGEKDESFPTPDLNSEMNLPTREVADFSVPVNGSHMTTTVVPIAELSEEDFPWEQRDDYEVQVDPKTKQIVNIRLQTTTTAHTPISKSIQFDDANDRGDRVRSQTRDRTRTFEISEFVTLDDEHDDVSVELSGNVRNSNSKIQTMVLPRRKDVGGHAARIDDELLDDGQRSRIAVLAVPNPNEDAIRKAVSRSRTKMRRPIFSHSDADGVLYFRYADDLWEQLEVEQFHRDAKLVLIDDNSWIASRRGRGRDSPYFYYSHSSSVLFSLSCYPALLVACLVFLIS